MVLSLEAADYLEGRDMAALPAWPLLDNLRPWFLPLFRQDVKPGFQPLYSLQEWSLSPGHGLAYEILELAGCEDIDLLRRRFKALRARKAIIADILRYST
jgi:hypothetical protein